MIHNVSLIPLQQATPALSTDASASVKQDFSALLAGLIQPADEAAAVVPIAAGESAVLPPVSTAAVFKFSDVLEPRPAGLDRGFPAAPVLAASLPSLDSPETITVETAEGRCGTNCSSELIPAFADSPPSIPGANQSEMRVPRQILKLGEDEIDNSQRPQVITTDQIASIEQRQLPLRSSVIQIEAKPPERSKPEPADREPGKHDIIVRELQILDALRPIDSIEEVTAAPEDKTQDVLSANPESVLAFVNQQ